MAILGLVIGGPVGYFVATVRFGFMGGSMTFESVALGMAAGAALLGALTFERPSGPLLIAGAAGISLGAWASVLVRPPPAVTTVGNGTFAIDSPANTWPISVACTHRPEGDKMAIGVNGFELLGFVDKRRLDLGGWVHPRFGAGLQLFLAGVPDSQPFVQSAEYAWTVPRLSFRNGTPGLVLADMPTPTDVPVPGAPAMTSSDVRVARDYRSGSFRFTGMHAVSADRPIGTFPLVLNGSLSWSCGT